MYVCMYVCMYIYIYIYIHTHTHTSDPYVVLFNSQLINGYKIV